MKTSKIKFAAEQLFFILLFNYILLFDSDFIYRENLHPTILFIITFFNMGTFSSLYYTLKTKGLTKEKESVLFSYNCFIYLFFIFLCVLNNCSIKSDSLMTNCFLAICILIITVVFIFETYAAYKAFKLKRF